jgi:predicted O-methyltransferase YrrM
MFTPAQKLLQLAPLVVREPGELYDRLRAKFEARADRRRATYCYDEAITLSEGLRQLDASLGASSRDILDEGEFLRRRRLVASRTRELRTEGPFATAHNGDTALGSMVYYACRALRPQVVVETGVAYGVTSAFILTAMERNGGGRLHSIDLPPLSKAGDAYVGAHVTGDLRPRWQLDRGASRRLLPRILDSLRRVDLFVHDSLHTHANMLWEFETVWPLLTPGGLLVVDDAGDNAAFAEFSTRVGKALSLVIREEAKDSLLGILRKPL